MSLKLGFSLLGEVRKDYVFLERLLRVVFSKKKTQGVQFNLHRVKLALRLTLRAEVSQSLSRLPSVFAWSSLELMQVALQIR